jgi:hypothetical protein
MRRLAFALAWSLAAPLALAADSHLYGKPLTGLAPTPLAKLLAAPQAGATVCLEGTVSAVCKQKGCWLELKQADQSVHVTFEGYSFFVPKDAAGKSVRLEGKVSVTAPDPEHVAHKQEEGASAAAASKVSVVATGVELK